MIWERQEHYDEFLICDSSKHGPAEIFKTDIGW